MISKKYSQGRVLVAYAATRTESVPGQRLGDSVAGRVSDYIGELGYTAFPLYDNYTQQRRILDDWSPDGRFVLGSLRRRVFT